MKHRATDSVDASQIDGTFDGPSFHTAEWDPSIDLTGKRVALVGTGCSAVQTLRTTAEKAAQTYVFQVTMAAIFHIMPGRCPL